MAKFSISTRWAKGVNARSSLCGGRAAGMNQTWSSSPCSRHCSARIKWPKWIGSNVPPKTPMRMASLSPGRCRQIHARLPQECRGLFGRDGIYVKPGAPLEAGDARQPGNDFQMPMGVAQSLRIKRRGVDDVIVRRLVQRRLDLQEDGLEHCAQLIDLGLLYVFEMTVVVLGHYPGLERKPAGIRGQDGEMRCVQDDAFFRHDFLVDTVAVTAATAVIEEIHGPGHFLPNADRHNGRHNEL